MDHSRYRDTAATDRRDGAIRRVRSITVGVLAGGAALTAVIGGLAATSIPGRGGVSTPAAAGDATAAQVGDGGGQLQPPDQAPTSGYGGGGYAVSGGS